MQHSTIQIGKNTVTKTTVPDLMRVEVEKTRRAFEIGRDCGIFRVPEVLEHDEVAGYYGISDVDVVLLGGEPLHNVVHRQVPGQLGVAAPAPGVGHG